jgi:Tol biopolymer transport system component
MALTVGSRLGPYEILALCGVGGMGEVYRARDSRLDRVVAVKVLPSELGADPIFRARFEREARAAAALAHPNICAIHDVGEAPSANGESTRFLVMEYLEGETLADRLVRGRLTLEKALEYAEHIAAALDNAHRRGIVHRDLKPANVMLTRTGAKLLDFGIARRDHPSDATSAHPLTATGAVLGTLDYMAPEQILGGTVDKRTDIFAFGVVLFEMLTGRRPFEGRSRTETLAAILERDASLAQIDAEVPVAVEHVVARCLAKDPDERWQDARDIAAALRLAAETRSSVRRHRRLRWPWALAGLGGGAVALVGAWSLLGNSGASSGGGAPPFTFEINAPAGTTFARAFSFPRPALSPDGTLLAYLAPVGAAQQVFVQRLGEGAPRPLAGTEDTQFIFWSPDGRFLGFIQRNRLRRIAVAPGGAPQDLTTSDAFGGTWGPDGTIVFGSGRILARVDAAGGEATPVTELDEARGEYSHRLPVMLRDGRRFLYLVLSADVEREGLYVGSLDDPELKQFVVQTNVNGQVGVGADGRDYLLFVRDFALLAQPFDAPRGSLVEQPVILAQPIMAAGGSRLAPFAAAARSLVYRINRFPRTDLLWVDRRGVPQSDLGVDGDQFRSPSLSRDGARVLVRRTSLASNELWTIDLTRENLRERLVTDPVAALSPVWAHDGGIVYAVSRGGLLDLRWRRADGREEAPFASREMSKYPTDVTTDGEVVFDAFFPRGNVDLWVLALAGEREPRPLLATPLVERDGHVSPDGRWLGYTLEEDGQQQVYVTSFATPSKGSRVSSVGGSHPRWRSDSAELYYLAPDDTVMAVAVRPGTTLELGAPEALFRRAFDDEAGTNGTPYAPAPDGQAFLVNESVEAADARLTVRMNWSLEPH